MIRFRDLVAIRTLDKKIAIRRRELLTHIFTKYRFLYSLNPNWQFSGDMANDPAMNKYYAQKDFLISRYVDKRKGNGVEATS